MSAAPARATRILVVDDDPLVLFTVAGGLRDAGYEVLQAGSGEEAVELLQLHGAEVDVALLDVRMPGLSGLDVADRLRSTQGPPFVFLSAFDDAETVRQAAEYGALGYLVKPLVVHQIVPTIEAAVARARELRGLHADKDQLRAAASGRQMVSMAIGILMERNGIDRERAFRVLRARARSQRRKLSDVAADIVEAAELLTVGDAEPGVI